MARQVKGLIERLDAGEVVIGDGGYVFELEKRGYVKAGPWTPECVAEHPEAVRQLHREFLRCGSDVIQGLTFYGSEDKLENRGNDVLQKVSCASLNETACKLAYDTARAHDAEYGIKDGSMVTASVSQSPTYLSGAGKAAVQEVFRKQIDAFLKSGVLDFLICEYFEHVEEAEWSIEVAAKSPLPVVATLCIGPEGDLHGVPPGECAVRMAKAGARVVGINCHFDPFVTLKTLALMKEGLVKEGLYGPGKTHLAIQPLGYMTPDAGKQGFIDLPEFPFALEPRVCTRWEMQKYAREAYEMGILFIGGCCGFLPYHIRAIAEELAQERGRLPPASQKHGTWGSELSMHTKPWVRARARRSYWEHLDPSTGRAYCSAYSKPADWKVAPGDDMLKQQKAKTTDKEVEQLAKKLEIA